MGGCQNEVQELGLENDGRPVRTPAELIKWADDFRKRGVFAQETAVAEFNARITSSNRIKLPQRDTPER